MKTIGQFGKINTRVLVEMWLFPKNRAFDTAVPLDCFEPTQRDKLQLIKSRSHQGSESLSPVQGPGETLPEYNHVLLLCPRDAKPAVIVIEKRRPLPQQSVKAYIINSGEQMTLVSVREPTKISWLLIPYYSDMHIWKAKDYIQKYYGSVLIDSCCFAGQSSQLDDNSTLF
ncbi:uncharacterized protein FOMMEDRAFT_21548, partial [Fomitiporia mediterranea MF3/22]|uniref:uncharacterized protein n=1 Tax=Fomitiporia mediterranea (strain MF3/22) TaxID=694068 RepID=UPI0004407FC5